LFISFFVEVEPAQRSSPTKRKKGDKKMEEEYKER
jgi:hypothetical protein